MVASTVDAELEESVVAEQAVNSDSYLGLHSAQMFREGLSFSGFERDVLFYGARDAGGGLAFADLSDLSHADSPGDGRAAVAADLDDDGDLDLFVHEIQRERHRLFRNDAAPGGFVKVRLRATSGQYEAVGATVVARAGGREVAQVLSRGAGFVSCQAPELVFGLGDAPAAELRVRWPGGALESFGSVAAGARVPEFDGGAR